MTTKSVAGVKTRKGILPSGNTYSALKLPTGGQKTTVSNKQGIVAQRVSVKRSGKKVSERLR
jgi:hypothetical protein